VSLYKFVMNEWPTIGVEIVSSLLPIQVVA
jgi:hypothetical protein